MGKMKAETLLRKIQKQGGQIINKATSNFNFNYNADKIQVFRKREIVRPYLHSIDSRIINEQIDASVSNKFRNDPKLAENLKKFLPNHLINDIYSMYYNRPGRLEFEGLSKTNKVKFDIMDSINNSLIKIVTNGSHIGSYVYAEEIGKYLYERFMTLPPEQQKQLQDSLQNCNQGGDEEGENEGKGKGQKKGSGDGKAEKSDQKDKSPNQTGQGSIDGHGEDEGNYDTGDSGQGMANNSNGENTKRDNSQDAVDKMLNGLLNSKESKKKLEESFDKAQEKLEKLKDVGVDYEGCEDMPDHEKNEIISNLNNLDQIKNELKGLNTSKEKVLKAVEKILNGTTNYFSKKCITNDVELFEAEQLLDINGLEFLHPMFKNSRLFDMSITERKYIGKFDLYIDCSGSMSGGCGGDLSSVQRITLAKSLAMQMKELGILGDLYEFEDKPKKINNTEISILMMRANGGTDIEKVMKNILKTGNNSVILTDGESYLETYTHKAFFIGVGTDFSYFGNDKNVGEKLVKNAQCVAYNGKEFQVATGQRTSVGRGW